MVIGLVGFVLNAHSVNEDLSVTGYILGPSGALRHVEVLVVIVVSTVVGLRVIVLYNNTRLVLLAHVPSSLMLNDRLTCEHRP